jgi:hypothetical protein
MSLSKEEAEILVSRGVERALASRPVPSTVSVAQAAEMLGVSLRTVTRRQPPRGIGGRIPYEWVLEQRAR